MSVLRIRYIHNWSVPGHSVPIQKLKDLVLSIQNIPCLFLRSQRWWESGSEFLHQSVFTSSNCSPNHIHTFIMIYSLDLALQNQPCQLSLSLCALLDGIEHYEPLWFSPWVEQHTPTAVFRTLVLCTPFTYSKHLKKVNTQSHISILASGWFRVNPAGGPDLFTPFTQIDQLCSIWYNHGIISDWAVTNWDLVLLWRSTLPNFLRLRLPILCPIWYLNDQND